MPRIVLILLACAACAPRATTTTRTTISRSVVAVGAGAEPWSGNLAAFTAAVPPFADGGRCETYDRERGRLVTLQFTGPGEARRTVALEVDAQGKVQSYSDVRGDLEMHGTGPLTSVTVGFDNNTATAMNERGGGRGTEGLTMGRAADAMDLENLGTPRRMMELVRQRCMAPQG